MDHQPDVQKQSLQEQHLRLQEQPNIVYIQNPQNYRSQNFSYFNEAQNNIASNQSFQEQNANYRQFENHCSFVNHEHFSSSNSSTPLISNSVESGKNKNDTGGVRNTQFISEHDSNSGQKHQRSDARIQFASNNFQSINLQGLNYQQTSPFYLQNIGNHYQFNDILVPTYQSSGSSESSDESPVSNVSQHHYSSDSSGLSNNQLEFPAPLPTNSQVSQNFQQLQQKDYLDNYMTLLQQDTQVPRCDSSKSEAADSTCSSLSSGSTESQSENENIVRVPVLVNPILNNNAPCNILHSYQTNIQNNVSSCSNQMHRNQSIEFVGQRNYINQPDQHALKCNNFTGIINPTNVTNGNINDINGILQSNSQVNNFAITLPNQQNKIQNCLTSHQPLVQNLPSSDVLDSSKFVIQNSKVNQQKIFSLVNVKTPLLVDKMNSPIQIGQIMKLNGNSNSSDGFKENDYGNSVNKKSENCGYVVCCSDENGNNSSTVHNCASETVNLLGEVTENCTSHIQNTSDSTVINSNFIQNNLTIKSVENENNSAMLLKETSDKNISQSVSDVNSSMVHLNNVYLVKNDEIGVIKNDCYENSSTTTSCPNTNSGTKVVPVPMGWRRLLVDGSIIYLSPTNIALSSIEQVKMYLQTMGTCKCGLECPVQCDSVFNFNPKVISRPWDSSDSEQTRLCNHKRKASDVVSSVVEDNRNIKLSRKECVPSKKKKKKHGSSCSGVSVSQLLAQRDRALAAASARWPGPAQIGNMSYQNVPNNQCQNVQVIRNQVQLRHHVYENNNQNSNSFKQETAPARTPDDKAAQPSCISVINNSVKEGTVVNINGVNQLLPENHSIGHDFIKSPQINITPLPNQSQEVAQGVVGHSINYQCGQDIVQNTMIGPRPEGIMLASQGMLFPSNVMVQRPRSIPPWHQTRLAINKKPVPETPVYDKVPYFQQHMPPPTLVFEENASRKKHKTHSRVKKASQEVPSNQPSFMENPSAYLAQQTALLHNTISRPNFNVTSDTRSAPAVLPQNLQNSTPTAVGLTPGVVMNNSTLSLPSGVFVTSTKNGAFAVRPLLGHKTEPNNLNQPPVCTKNISEKVNADSAEASSKTNSTTNQNFQEFNYASQNCGNTNFMDSKSPCLFDEISEKNLGKQQINEKVKTIQENLEKSDSKLFHQNKFKQNEWRQLDSSTLIDQNNSIDENPVTSSTEKAPAIGNRKIYCDFRPIQGGTISTSNGSPQPLPSPSSSNIFRQEVSSPKCSELISHNVASKNVQISSMNSSFAISNGVSFNSVREHDTNSGQRNFENSSKKPVVAVSQQMQTLVNAQLRSTSPECSEKFKLAKFNFSCGKTSNQNFQSNSDNQEGLTKRPVQLVSSTLDLQNIEKAERNENKGNKFVRTMASGHTVSSNTITSVQAGRAQTATVTVNNHSSNPPTTISFVNLSEQNVVNIPLNQKGNSKSPLEMVQNVVSSIQSSSAIIKNELPSNMNKNVFPTSVINNILTTTANANNSILANNSTTPVIKTAPGSLQTGHILVSNNGQYIVASSGNVIPQTNLSNLKLNQTSPMPPMSASPVVTNVTGAVTQVLPAVGVAQQVLGQPTVLVNALPTPFVIQPGVMAVETGLGRLAVATGNVLQSSLIENNALRNTMRGVTSPDKVKNKKGNKKRKNQVTSLVQMASPNNLILNQPFNQPNFAVSPGNNVQSLPALTLVQGKHGGPAQIVMNNQNNFNQFNSQPQQINLLQPVNLTSVPNFPSFQQFIVPGLGNMVMSTDGTTTILPDTNIGVQLQLQNVNGQNVLTPVQNASFINSQGILTTPTGMLIRAPNNQQKIIQNSSSPQFLSPNNNQFLVNQFQGQLSPLITSNLSPNQQLFTSSPPRQSPQEFIQIIPTSNAQNTTVVQQNTTIVQQQTTMVSNNQNVLNNNAKSNFILNNPNAEKSIELQIVRTPGQTSQTHLASAQIQSQQLQQQQRITVQEKVDIGTQHSVSTQTSGSKENTPAGVATNNTFCQTLNSNWNGSPPDTTTHSPVESESNYKRTQSPTTDENPDNLPQAMVQYVSSSINESESEGETYFLPGIPKILKQSNNTSKNIVESSTFLQEAGVQIQIGGSYGSSGHLKSNIDECFVSSHSDVNVQDKHLDTQSNITSYHEEKGRLVNVLLGERSDDLDDEGTTDVKEKFSEGDLVWGPVRGSPAWPGKLVGPIGPGGKALVRWFGGHCSPTRVNVSQLQSLSQGLDAHHRASNKGRKNRRLNIELEAAIQEAMLELDKMTAQPKKVSSSVSGRPRRSHR